MGNDKKTAIIIGAGPAGLTAAYELLVRTDIKPVIFEMTSHIGGISKTINYKGNRIDIGGHRFFSRSEQIMNWWLNIFPVENGYLKPQELDNIMLVRKRVSRIFFLRKFFDYPVSLNKNTILNLGFIRMLKIGLSYIYASLFPVKEHSLEDFFINRFGKELYSTFFKDYTEKVWGVPCRMIKPEWGAQRIKGLSVKKALLHAVKSIFFRDSSLSQKNTETSLIDQFIYPKFGPGQLWEEVAKIITDKGGEIFLNHRVIALDVKENSIITSKVRNDSGVEREFKGDYFFSTMAVRDLIGAMETVPKQVREVAQGLKYRDFITVGLLLKSLKIKEKEHMIPDNWIYIQESDVKIGRVQIFNNWSPYMVKDEHTVWLGLEYFCNEGDMLWNMADKEFISFAIDELVKIDFINKEDVLDGVIIREFKTYPAYFGTYDQFHIIREYIDKFENLFLIGRNGMHRYNNQDHSMLTAITAVEHIINNIPGKDKIWHINTEEEYNEEK